MSILVFRPYFSVVEYKKCSISVYNRFLIALFILGLGLTTSALTQMIPSSSAPAPIDLGTSGDEPCKGKLESFPRDFLFSLTEPVGSYCALSKETEDIKHSVSKVINEMPDVSLDKEYHGIKKKAHNTTLNTNAPKLDLSTCSDEEALKFGYRRHKTVNGDTLTNLAQKYLNDPSRWNDIYLLNASRLHSSKVVPIGIILVIPAQ